MPSAKNQNCVKFEYDPKRQKFSLTVTGTIVCVALLAVATFLAYIKFR
jgi:hypothetical protein